ncbi:tRNA methyltransferase [Plasmodium cynomolgi strain B]|uniref:tRNA methyltransferase n=1 Tax=Plasmodium cynomolgi (strain B) TaxID=1120755 RepID=K6UQX8_PLACD|nr:tRNA methyltransferase [Plasmodium cynomolgi strain B]GAB65409.1 tRNA methyltransferase [Plasmodium cynomolgi strain B]
MNEKGTHRWKNPKCYIVKGALRRRLSKGRTPLSVNKLNRCAVTHLSSEHCSGDEKKRNEKYEAHIRNVFEELQRMTDREEKMKHLMREYTNVCRVSFSEPLDRKKFTLTDNSKLGSAGRRYFINEVREGVIYRYVDRCNSNLYVAVDVVEGREEQECEVSEEDCKASGEGCKSSGEDCKASGKDCEVHSSCPSPEQSIPPNSHSGDRTHWRSILGRKKFLITVDGFSDNIVLSCFLQVLLKGLKKLDLGVFLNMGFEGVVNQLSSLYTIHVEGEHLVGHVIGRVERFLGRLCGGVRSRGVGSRRVNCSKSDLKYVKKICSKRKKLFIININEEYTEQVLIPMLRSYSEGHIPNADIMCNEKVKYNLLMRMMRKVCRERGGGWDYSYVSTGHYAMISTNDEANANRLFNGDFPYVGDDTDGEGLPRRTPRKRYRLIVGRDEKKDQTFFLSSFSEKQLSRFLFPLCLHRKSDVKRLMEGRAAGQYNRRETRGLCLYGRVDMHSLLGLYLGGGGVRSGRGEGESERGSPERERGSVERERGSPERERGPAGRGLQWAKDQLRSPEFRAFQEKHLPSFNLRFRNHIINVEEGTVLDSNNDIHLYAIGQKKHITNYLHQLYNSKKGRGRSCEKNAVSSCQWTVVYKKMLGSRSGDVKENFIYVSRDYESGLFRHLRGRCRLGAFRWVASAPPSYLLGVEAAPAATEAAGAEAAGAEEADAADAPLTVPPTANKRRGRAICVKIRNSERIKEAKIALDDLGETAYLTLRQKDIGLSPGQIVTLYLPFIVKRNGKTKYVYSLRRSSRSRSSGRSSVGRGEKKDRPTFFHCLGSARITNQYLNRGLYRRLMEIHRRNNLPLWGRDEQCGVANSE